MPTDPPRVIGASPGQGPADLFAYQAMRVMGPHHLDAHGEKAKPRAQSPRRGETSN
jgi:hypothetical protein